MNNFSDFGIKPAIKNFTGEKIKIGKVLNREIIVYDSKVETSKFEGKGDCLYLQIEIDGVKRVVFTGSKILMELIKAVPAAGFPFKTTIVEVDEHFEFE